MAGFHYSALELEDGLIRVIWVLPDEQHKPIRCRMASIPLDDHYIALSYVWGEDAATERIEVNGKPFYVRQNLHDFLHHARTSYPGEFLWIDAMCINQQDTEERNHQVRQMDRIYRSAHVVVSWLGSGDEDLEAWLPHDTSASITEISHETIQQYIEDAPVEVVLENLMTLSELEYWQRLWIVPEVLAAEKLQILYGRLSLSWSDLGVLLGYIFTKEDTMNKIQAQQLREIRGSRMAAFVAERLEQTNAVRQYKFQTLLSSYGMNDCSDKRDRVFALITLAGDMEASEIDYNEDAQALCVRIIGLQKMSISELCPFAYQLLSILELENWPLWSSTTTSLATPLHLPLSVKALSAPLRKKDVRWREVHTSLSLLKDQLIAFRPANFTAWREQNRIELFETTDLDARFTIVTRRTEVTGPRNIVCIIQQFIWRASPELTIRSHNIVYRVPGFGILNGDGSDATLQLSQWASLQVCLDIFNITLLKSRDSVSKTALNRGFARWFCPLHRFV